MNQKAPLARIFKHAMLLGMGMAVDLSGSAFTPPIRTPQTLGQHFHSVGDYLRSAITQESAAVRAELCACEQQQLQLQLGRA